MHPMNNIPIRKLSFEFESVEYSSPLWSKTNPYFAMSINSLSAHVPAFERFLIAVCRSSRKHLTDPKLIADVKSLIGQEANHQKNIDCWVNVLSEHYPGYREQVDTAETYFKKILKTKNEKFLLGYIAGYETFNMVAGKFILGDYKANMEVADPAVRALWVWHQVEEIEHGAVAFDLFQAIYPNAPIYRRFMTLVAFFHMYNDLTSAYHCMVKGEGWYRSPRKALKAWLEALKMGLKIVSPGLSTLKKGYHPRKHPMCNGEQDLLAVAWRFYHQAGHDVCSLSEKDINKILTDHQDDAKEYISSND